MRADYSDFLLVRIRDTMTTPGVSASQKTSRGFDNKQMGDAAEMLVAAELTFGGVPALKVPDNWPGYDLIAQKRDDPEPQRISVKSRTYKKGGSNFVVYGNVDPFDWLAVVLLACPEPQKPRRIFLIPRAVADAKARQDKPTAKTNERYWSIDQTEALFAEFEDNFGLALEGRP